MFCRICNIIRYIRQLATTFQLIQFYHMFREANFLDDAMTELIGAF